MLSRLATVLQELSGEEGADGESQGVSAPAPPEGEAHGAALSEAPDEAMERLAHLEQLVVRLKEMIRDKDSDLLQKNAALADRDAQLKSEKEAAEARFTKLKLQAKAKMAALNKQIGDLKGQEGPTSPDGSFTKPSSDEELLELQSRLSKEEAASRVLRERLQAAELLLQDREAAHAEQVRLLQAVVCEKDVRFQEQIQKHEEELLKDASDLQQALQSAQRRCEELEEALVSRAGLLEMLQQEVTSADQQKQILTAQFRQMEQELAEAVRLRGEHSQQASRAEAELTALRSSLESLQRGRADEAKQEAELAALREALEQEKMRVAGLECQLSAMRAAELAHQEASERATSEILRLENELAAVREAGSATEHASRRDVETAKCDTEKLTAELASLREGRVQAQNKTDLVEEIWRRLKSLGEEEPSAVPSDLSDVLGLMKSVEARVSQLKDRLSESEGVLTQHAHTVATLQEQLEQVSSEREDAFGQVQQLEQQIQTMTEEQLSERPCDQSAQEKAQLSMEPEGQGGVEETEAAGEPFQRTEEQTSSEVQPDHSPDQHGGTTAHDTSTYSAEGLEDSPEEETTLVAEDNLVLSSPAEHESSPELIGPQSESPEESKATSSDEMVASTDSEVAHSSWTILEAVNQDSSQEWPSMLQDFGQLQLQTWEETSMDQETSTVQVESSSVVIRESVHIQLTQQSDSVEPSGQAFAQLLAEELQRRYSQLLSELQGLREAAAESQEKITSLSEETATLASDKEEARTRAEEYAEELASARESVATLSQHSSSLVEKHGVEMQLLEEQIEILSCEKEATEQQLRGLRTELDAAHLSLAEQESQARLLSVQLEDREMLSSELEKKLQELEENVLGLSRTSERNDETLSRKDAEIGELQQSLSQKEQEMLELNDSMSAKLLHAEEEKFVSDREVKNLKEQIVALEMQKVSVEDSQVDEELVSLRKLKEELEGQLITTKKKLQVALVQRKELLKKVADYEEAKHLTEKGTSPAAGVPADVSAGDQPQVVKEMETRLVELEQALKSKEEEVEVLQQKVGEQEKIVSEALASNKKLSEEADNKDAASPDVGQLQGQVASLQAECESLQKRVAEAQESRKETIRKAKEKDRRHREHLKQQKEEYSELMERFELQTSERDALLTKLKESEEKSGSRREDQPLLERPTEGVQEDWVDFAASEESPATPEERVKVLKEELNALQMANTELENQLQETQGSLALKESQWVERGEELQALKENERQMESLSKEIDDLREKCCRAESYTEALKAEVKATSEAASSESAATIAALQAEMVDVKQFLDKKNQEILELSQQLTEQNALIHSMQSAVSHKDELMASLESQLSAEKERSLKLEVQVPLKQEEENDSEQKLQQLQRKLQAALISRKDAMKENKAHKEQLALNQSVVAELKMKLQSAEEDMEKLGTEKMRLIEEVDRMLLENQSLGSSCESLKLAMEGILNEKEACAREAEFAKEDAARISREWEEKVQNMKEEYETLLKSYENVSDEAERVRRVLEAARQERQELAARVRTSESARLEAEKQVEEAQKEVETVKDKMRKFVKTKQQKILELEEENERLREMKETPLVKHEPLDVERLREELQAARAELQAAVEERSRLQQQVERMGDQPGEHDPVAPEASALGENVMDSQSSDVTQAEFVPALHRETSPAEVMEPRSDMTEAAQVSAEDGDSEREQWRTREAELRAALSSLEKELGECKERAGLVASLQACVQECRDRESSLTVDFAEKEGKLKELLRSTEAEKDNLEERLMNQLAHVNGSIAGYQQEAADHRELLAKLQREVEVLERGRAELEVEAQNQGARADRLEEDIRQAQRLRAEAEADAGKQRELEQQLRSAQRVREGSQSRARQLEELLREKQMEVRQLQRDCIQYQERISELGRDAKSLQLGHHETQKRLEQAQLESSKLQENLSRTEAELVSCRSDLSETRQRLSDAVSEKLAGEESAQKKEASMKAEAEQTLDSVRFRLGAELKDMELRLEELYSEKEREEDAKLEARDVAVAADRRAQEMQARLDESLARLAAFSRCMSSLQDDRDRVLDETRQWETRFNNALQGKDAEVREAETRAKGLAEQLHRESELKEELRSALTRLEKEEQVWQLRLDEAEGNYKISQAVLEEERATLQQATADLLSARNEIHKLKGELESVHQRAKALEEAVGKLQTELEQTRSELSHRESEERRLCLTVEQLEMDLRSSKTLTESLQTELNEKEQREVDMLVEKEQAVAQAAEEARKEMESRAQGAEEELEQRRGELRELEERLRRTAEESSNNKARLDSFTSAMGSLQDDRDRVLSMYKQLEEKHLQVMMEKDALIQEAASENNGLKGELRSLLVQRDDLHAEKGKLSAQLHGYREELNQVLSMKDSQHRQLQASQREKIASLEKEREELESQLQSFVQAREMEVGAGQVEREVRSRTAPPVDAPGAEVEKLREQLQASREQVASLEATLQEERSEQQSRSKELSELRWEGGVMRTESETAQERVAELARDLLAVEQKLLEEKELTSNLKAENQSFAKAMASLQDSRDQAENSARELTRKLEGVSKASGQSAPSSPGGATGEVWGLKNALQALQNDRERLLEQLQTQSNQLKSQKSELARLGAGQLIQVSQELMEERSVKEEMLRTITQLESTLQANQQDVETLRLERLDWMAQAEQLKHQTLATLAERDQQLRQLSALLEEARSQKPQLQQDRYLREGSEEVDSAPGAPQEKSSLPESFSYNAEMRELQQRLEEEVQQRMVAEEQLMAAQERLRRQAKWQSEEEHSETAVFIEPQEGAVTRTRRGGRGVTRMVRGALCSRQRTPLLLGLYLLTVHVLLLLCMGGYL
ncbi:golgin subfamily B member 1 [Neosynchiropus ocellatus]